MTALRSTSNSKLKTYFLYRLGKLRGTLISTSVISLLSYPVIAASAYVYYYIRRQRELFHADTLHPYPEFDMRMSTLQTLNEIVCAVGVFLAFFLLLEGFFAANRTFRYLYDKKYTDMAMGLPLDHNTRFFGDMLAGLTAYALPMVVSVIIANIMLIPVFSFSGESYWSDYLFQTDFVRYGSIFVVSGCIMQFFFSLMILSFCGKKLTAYMFPIVLGIAVPLTVAFLKLITQATTYGVGIEETSLFEDPYILQCSPIGMCMSVFTMQTWEMEPYIKGPVELAGLLYSAAFGAAAYFMIKYRRAERTGSAFVYKGGRYAAQFLILLGGASVICLPLFDKHKSAHFVLSGYMYRLLSVPEQTLFTAWVIVGLVIFVVIELISGERLGKIKRLSFSVLRYVLSAGLSLVICTVFANVDGFGAASYVPSVNDTENIRINIYMPSAYTRFNAEPVFINDPSDMQQIIDFHRRITEERPDIRDKENEYTFLNSRVDVNLKYELKNGKTVDRRYYLTPDYAEAAYNLYFDCGAYVESLRMSDSYDNEDIVVNYRVLRTDGKDSFYEYLPTDVPYNRLREAFKKDAEAMTYEKMFFTDGIRTGYISVQREGGYMLYSFPVLNLFENTTALFREYGYDLYNETLDDVDKYFIFKRQSVGKGTFDLVFEASAVINGTSLYDTEFREITKEQADILLEHASQLSAFRESRDVYIIRMSSKRYSTYEGEYYYAVTHGDMIVSEKYSDEAAEIYEQSPVASEEDVRKYIMNNG